MSTIFELHERYDAIIRGSFNKQDQLSVAKAVTRSKKVLPRGRVYHKMIKREVLLR